MTTPAQQTTTDEEARFCVAHCRTEFIPDEPSDKDALTKGNIPGPHERVAIALAEMIHHDTGGKMVGIEGAWGSGKSTVISLLRKKLRGDDDPIPWRRNPDIKSEVFCFDVWAHEGDPLRRTFLESLIETLRDRNWVDENRDANSQGKWKEFGEILSGRRTSETVDVETTLTPLAKASAAVLVLSPLGSALLSGPAGKELRWVGLGNLDLQTTLGIGFLVVPLLWFLVALLSTKKRAFFSGTTEQRTKTVAFRSIEPTSVEFETHFRDLLRDALGLQRDRRLVIVVDNLDRVEPEDARKIWSTLQVFLGDRAVGEWFKRAWFLVPYDPNGLTALWGDSKKKGPPTEKQGSRKDNPEVGVRESFLDKSFQLRFEVPPAALSDWQGHLRGLIRTALPDHSSDAHDVSRVVAHCLKKRDETPTLRALTNIVNQIGVVHRQWTNAFDLRHVAYYVMLRRYQVDVVKGLRDGELLDEEIVEVLEGDSTSTLAALAFNLPPRQALQVLLAGRIKRALSENKPEALTKLLTDHEDGFWAVLEHSARDIVAAEAPELARTALCLQAALSDHESHTALGPIRSALVGAVFNTKVWAPLNEELAKGTIALCRNFAGVGGLGVWKSIQKKLADRISESGLGNPEKEAPEAIKFLQLLASKMPDRLTDVRFELYQQEDYWRALCPVLADQDKNGTVTSLLEPLCVKEFREGLLNRINNGDQKPELPMLVEVSLRSASKFGFEALLQPIANRFAVATQRSHPEGAALLETLGLLKKYGVPDVEPALRALATQPGLAHWIAREWGQGTVQWYGSALLLIYRPALQPYGGHPAHIGQAQEGLNQVDRLLRQEHSNVAIHVLEALKAFDGLDAIPSSPHLTNSPVLQEMLRAVAENELTAISAGARIQDWQAFVSAFGSVMPQYAEQNPGAVVSVLFEGIVDSRSEAGLQWLAEFAEAHPDFLDDHPRAFEFKERVQIARRELDSPEFKRIARAWRIEPLKTHEVIDTKE